MAKPLIAVVNDDPTFLTLMEQVLEEEGYRVTLLHEAGDAYATIKRHQPELVILDLRIGTPDAGWKILEVLRLDPATTAIPIIICSADLPFLRTGAERLRRMRCECLPKPFDLEELTNLVSEMLNRG
jgi:CheY-like chemotaxis protein